MYLTMYLFKKICFMVLSDREWDTERPCVLALILINSKLFLFWAHIGHTRYLQLAS